MSFRLGSISVLALYGGPSVWLSSGVRRGGMSPIALVCLRNNYGRIFAAIQRADETDAIACRRTTGAATLKNTRRAGPFFLTYCPRHASQTGLSSV